MSEEAVSSLELLASFLEEEKFTLLLPQQIKDEFERIKKSEIRKATDQLSSQINNLCKKLTVESVGEDFPEWKELQQKLESTKKEVQKFGKKCLQRHEKHVATNGVLNKSLKRIWKKAVLIPENESLQLSAYFRMLKGNPPNKNGKPEYGDALIWESLLQNHADDDLIIVSRDPDWEDQSNKGELDSYLMGEWKKRSRGKDATLHKSLAKFVKSVPPGKKLKKKAKQITKDVIEEELHYTFRPLTHLATPTTSTVFNSALNNDLFSNSISSEDINASVFNSAKNNSSISGYVPWEDQTSVSFRPARNCFRCGKPVEESNLYYGIHSTVSLCDECSRLLS